MKNNLIPRMSQKELNLFKDITQGTSNYFEFGIGGSTVFVYNETCANIRGVDSSKCWIEDVYKYISKDRVLLHHADIGDIGEWGKPINTTNKHAWPDYSSHINKTDILPDVIYIDGRFRVACLIQSILFSIKNNIDPIILLHDCNREYYKTGVDMMKRIDRVESLSVFRCDLSVCVKVLEIKYNEYKYIFE